MTRNDSNANRIKEILTTAVNAKLYWAGAAIALPIFVALGSDYFSEEPLANVLPATTLKEQKQNFSPTNETKESSQTESQVFSQTDSDNDDEVSGAQTSSQTTVTVDGQSVVTNSVNNTQDQSVNKTITTENGTANISIQQNSSSTNNGHTATSENVRLNSNVVGDSNISVHVQQFKSGGATH